MKSFRLMSHKRPDIRCQMKQALINTVEINHRNLASIIKIIVFCGCQNVAIHGHRDDATDLERDTSENYGNLWALFRFRVDAGDVILQEHLETASKNALYMSSIVQNQLIDIICNQIQYKILDKVKQAK